MIVRRSRLGSYALVLTRSDRATLVAAVLAVAVSLSVVLAPLPARVKILVMALCGAAPIGARYALQGDLFAPSGFLGLAYLITVFGPVLDIKSFGPDDRAMLLGNGLDYLVIPMLLIVAFISIVMSVLALLNASISDQPKMRAIWNRGRARKIGVVLSLVGAVALGVWFISSGISLGSVVELSSKRQPRTEYIRWGAQFLMYGALILFADFIEAPREDKWASGVLFLGAASLAVFQAFAASQRSVLLLFIISLLVVAFYRTNWVSKFKVSLAIPLAIIVSNAMLTLRKAGWQDVSVDPANLIHPSSFVGFFEAVRGGLLSHAHLVHMVPGQLDYAVGSTLFRWAIFPVPRVLWPAKPGNLGEELGVAIYGAEEGVVGAGTPPLIPGELFLNFGLIGLIVGGLFLGFLIAWGYSYLRPTPAGGSAQAVLYAVFSTQFVFGLLRGDLTPTIVSSLKWAIVIVPAVLYISGGLELRVPRRLNVEDSSNTL